MEKTDNNTDLQGADVIGMYDADKAYDFRIEYRDRFNTTISLDSIPTAEVAMSWSKKGIGVGKVWEKGALDVRGDSYFEGDIYQQGKMLFGIIESGENKYGEYIKFSDGRMICWIGDFRLSQLGTSDYYITDVWTFPKSFIEPPVVFPVGSGHYTTAIFASLIVGYSTTTETTTRINAWKRDSGKITETDRTKGVNIMAIGRWK